MTIIAVAHRLATIQKADNIFVFGESASHAGTEILEKGTHHELLQNKGPYWQMVRPSLRAHHIHLIVMTNRRTVPGSSVRYVALSYLPNSYIYLHEVAVVSETIIPFRRRSLVKSLLGLW